MVSAASNVGQACLEHEARLPPRCSHASSARWGANGATRRIIASRSARVARLTPPSASTFRYSISAAIAVLNCMRSRSAVTRLIVLWRRRRCGSSAGALAASHSSHEAPDALDEAVHALDGARIPRLGQLELAHEQLVQAQHVGAVVADDVVGVDAVHLRLRHLLDADLQLLAGRLQERLVTAQLDLAELVVPPHRVLVRIREHRPLVAQLLERLLRADRADVEQHLVPEARVQQVQHARARRRRRRDRPASTASRSPDRTRASSFFGSR